MPKIGYLTHPIFSKIILFPPRSVKISPLSQFSICSPIYLRFFTKYIIKFFPQPTNTSFSCPFPRGRGGGLNEKYTPLDYKVSFNFPPSFFNLDFLPHLNVPSPFPHLILNISRDSCNILRHFTVRLEIVASQNKNFLRS